MGRKMEYCQRLAAECAQGAQETEDAEEREFLNHMRDNWLQVAPLNINSGSDRFAMFNKQAGHRPFSSLCL
jgi:hypothetical protein